MCKKLSDDELWEKCGRDEPISCEEMGITKSSQDGMVALNEGFNVLTFEDHSSDKEKQ